MSKSDVRSFRGIFNSQLESCSKETLIALITTYARLYTTMDGRWYKSIQERFGDEQAIDLDIKVWEKQSRKEVKELIQTKDVGNRDVLSFIELTTMLPSTVDSEGEVEVISRCDCILNITMCPVIQLLEEESLGREKQQCEVICQGIMTASARSFNPGIRITPLKLPPRQSPDEIYCRWRYTLKEEE